MREGADQLDNPTYEPDALRRLPKGQTESYGAELTAIRAVLRGQGKIALDTCVFIYLVEKNPRSWPLAREIFAWLERSPDHAAVTSTITLTEVLVRPYRTPDERLVNRYFALFSLYPNLEWVAPDLAIADTAARLRVEHRLRTPDALQVATAIKRDASVFVTNDVGLTRVSDIRVEILDRFL